MKVILVAFIIGIAFSFAPPAHAVNAVHQLDVAAKLQTDGSVIMEQTIYFGQRSSLDWPIFSNTRDLTVQADNNKLSPKLLDVDQRGGSRLIRSGWEAKVWRISYRTTTALIRRDDRDQLYYKVFEEPGRQIYRITARFELPTDKDTNLAGNAYSFGGVVGVETNVEGANAITYIADSAGPRSLFTISASWSKNILRLSPLQELRLNLLDLELLPWLGLGVLLPLISLIVLGQLLLRQRLNEKKVAGSRDKPPSALAPVLVGVLVNKKIHPNEIVALLVDLCQRGYLVIVKKGSQYFLGQRRPLDEHLQGWEKAIVSQVFPQGDVAVSEQHLRGLGQEALFSPRVRQAFGQIYETITNLQIFAENPHFTRVRYKLIALGFYFLGAFGLIWTAISGSSPYLIIPLAGTIFIAFIIIRLTPQLIHYTPVGLVARQSWLEFGNYLSKDEPLELEAAQNKSFEKYLAYAISLHKTIPWSQRFDASSLAIIKPDWFITYQESSTAELSEQLVEFTSVISKELAKLKGPLVN